VVDVVDRLGEQMCHRQLDDLGVIGAVAAEGDGVKHHHLRAAATTRGGAAEMLDRWHWGRHSRERCSLCRDNPTITLAVVRNVFRRFHGKSSQNDTYSPGTYAVPPLRYPRCSLRLARTDRLFAGCPAKRCKSRGGLGWEIHAVPGASHVYLALDVSHSRCHVMQCQQGIETQPHNEDSPRRVGYRPAPKETGGRPRRRQTQQWGRNTRATRTGSRKDHRTEMTPPA